MKILVIGGSGLIGSHILRMAKQAGHDAVGTYRKVALPGLIPLDCADLRSAEKLVTETNPDAVVHAAGWTWVDGCEADPARAFAENAEQPAAIAGICHQRKIHFSYFSSSYVFDGADGPYKEDAIPNPISVYGKSKLEAEKRIQEACGGSALVARVICVYGAEHQKKNFAYQVWTAMREGKTLVLPSDQCGNPTYATDIARWLTKLLEKGEREVWHLAGPWPDCTRPEWAEKLVAAFSAAGVTQHPNFAIKTIPTAELKQKALRPLRAGLLSTKRSDGIDFAWTDFDKSIAELVHQASG